MAATLLPPLATLLLITTADLGNPAYWLKTATVTIGSFAAASIYTLTQLNSSVGNPPIVVPGHTEVQPVIIGGNTQQ